MLMKDIAQIKLELLKNFYNEEIISNLSGLVIGILDETESITYDENTKAFVIDIDKDKYENVSRAIYMGLTSYLEANSEKIHNIFEKIYKDSFMDTIRYIILNPNMLISQQIMYNDNNRMTLIMSFV